MQKKKKSRGRGREKQQKKNLKKSLETNPWTIVKKKKKKIQVGRPSENKDLLTFIKRWDGNGGVSQGERVGL